MKGFGVWENSMEDVLCKLEKIINVKSKFKHRSKVINWERCPGLIGLEITIPKKKKA